MNNPVIVNKNLVLLARVLERLERSRLPVDAQQYRSVVNHLASELAVAPQNAALQTVLRACPAASEVYENLNYQKAGLCRTDSAAAVAAGQIAFEAIARARRFCP